MKRSVVITRDDITKTHSFGMCYVYNENKELIFTSYSLERGWRDNENNVSCIPAGEYPLKYEYSNRFKRKLWEIYETGHRKECKFHSANFWFQLNGCIALGDNRADINNDGELDITNSAKTMKLFHEALKGATDVKLNIINLDLLLHI